MEPPPAVEKVTFHERIAANKRSSFLLAAGISLLIVACGYVFGAAIGGDPETAGLCGMAIAGALALGLSLASWFGGDAIVMRISGAREVTRADMPQLHNVVEEMCIAAGGLPKPRVYVIDDGAPNAFATGRDPAHARIAVTKGLLGKLERSELQGVIAHELAHVANYDIRFGMLVGVMVGTVALLSDFFLRIARYAVFGKSRGRRKGGGGIEVAFLVLALVLAIVAPIVAKLVQLAISREREFLADATAVRLTRHPEGLATALEKIEADREVLEAANRATQHLYIETPIRSFEERGQGHVARLIATHPPTAERVRRLRAMA